MKNKFYSIVTLAAVLVLLVAVSSCHRDKPANGSIGLHLHTQIDTNEVAVLGQLYPDHNGRLMAINDARFYITDISLQNSNGTWYDIPNSMILKTYEVEEYFVASVPSGNYTSIRFYVGLDSATNASLPSSHNSSSGQDTVLSSILEPNMYFGAGQGYKFLYLAGSILPTGSHSPVAVNYQIGGVPNRQLITMPLLNYTVLPNLLHYVHIWCDYGKLLEGINISTGNNDIGNTFGSGQQISTATLVADSIQNMFTYEPGQQ